MVHERDQRPAGQVLRPDLPVAVPVRPEPVFLRFPQQEPAIRGGSRRAKAPGVPRRHAGPVQLQPRGHAHEPRLVPGRRRSHLPHRPRGVPAQGLHTAGRHRYVSPVPDTNRPRPQSSTGRRRKILGSNSERLGDRVRRMFTATRRTFNLNALNFAAYLSARLKPSGCKTSALLLPSQLLLLTTETRVRIRIATRVRLAQVS